MSAHTPGPWETNGFNIFGPQDPQSKHENGRTLVGGVVDDANDWRCRPVGEPIERARFRAERIANANLIAAAPDLLEACKASVARCRFDCTHESHCGQCEPLVRAIAKATGGDR